MAQEKVKILDRIRDYYHPNILEYIAINFSNAKFNSKLQNISVIQIIAERARISI